MPHRVITLASILIALVSLSLWAAEKHSGHTPGMSHGTATNSGGQPQEGGQATFAALVEIVAMLEQDTETDWDTVDICLLYTSPSPRDRQKSRMPSSA